MLQECRSVELFERLNKISEGTYGVVYRAQEKETQRIVALKKVRVAARSDFYPAYTILVSPHQISLRHVHHYGSSLSVMYMWQFAAGDGAFNYA